MPRWPVDDSPDGQKRCSRCGEVKAGCEFKPQKRWCRDCIKQYDSVWYKKNSKKINKSKAAGHAEYSKKHRKVYSAMRYFNRLGFCAGDINSELIDAKIKHIELIRAIKSQKESHKEVTNG